MRTEEFNEFRALLKGVHDFYGKDVSQFGLDVWWQAMQRYDLLAVRDALGRHCMNPDAGQWLPKPADVVKMLEGGTLDSAQLAWTKVQDAIHAVGTYSSVCFDDPIINAVIADMGGWIERGQVSLDELPFDQKQFEARYRGYRLRGKVENYPRSLLGILERDNNAKGHYLTEPVALIGDEARAKLVYERGGEGVRLTVTPLIKALPAPSEAHA